MAKPTALISNSVPRQAPGERTVCLVSCVGKKQSHPAPAKDLYQSAWFKKAKSWVEASGSQWYILSAEYGLVDPHQVIKPYDKTLNTMGVAARRKWASFVAKQLKSEIGHANRIVILAGARYREYLLSDLREIADTVEVPMEGLSIGKQLQWLGKHDAKRLADLRRFYALLEDLEQRLGGARRLKESHGRLSWPSRGLYFFFEPGEMRKESGSGPRVVRVGTHALKAGSKTSIWNRLSQHRGTTKTGSGNHRGSIFRLIVGAALIKRGDLACESWGVASYQSQAAALLNISKENVESWELPIERRVSEFIGNMPFLWLPVDDEPGPTSRRGYLEWNAIALLSNHGKSTIDAASDGWLGRNSDRELVRQSGLWNNNHVRDVYDVQFLDELQTLIASQPSRS